MFRNFKIAEDLSLHSETVGHLDAGDLPESMG